MFDIVFIFLIFFIVMVMFFNEEGINMQLLLEINELLDVDVLLLIVVQVDEDNNIFVNCVCIDVDCVILVVNCFCVEFVGSVVLIEVNDEVFYGIIVWIWDDMFVNGVLVLLFCVSGQQE